MSEDEPVDHKRVVILPGPLDRVDFRGTFKSLIKPTPGIEVKTMVGQLSLSIQSVQSDRAAKPGISGCIPGVYLHVVVRLGTSQEQRQRLQA